METLKTSILQPATRYPVGQATADSKGCSTSGLTYSPNVPNERKIHIPATPKIIIWTSNHDIDLLNFVFVYKLTKISMDVFIFFFNIPVYRYPGYRQVFATFNETLHPVRSQRLRGR